MLRLHHMNVCSDNLQELTDFYKNALGLEQLPAMPMTGEDGSDAAPAEEWGTSAQFFQAGHPTELQIHIAQRRAYVNTEYGHAVNPLANGHFCFRTDNISEVLQCLEDNNVPYSDYGYWAIQGWRQVFFSDPAGNIIEVHQLDDTDVLASFEPQGLLRLHHINLVSDNLPELSAFYNRVLGLEQLPAMPMTGEDGSDAAPKEEWGSSALFFNAGHRTELQIHVAQRRAYVNYEYDQAINPMTKGHFCFRTNDIDAVLERLREHHVPYSDYGYWAIQGWRQVFLSDPAGNIIEIHQLDQDPAS